MAVGRITGPLLKANLLRDGVDLAFETDLLYLDVNNKRVGIKTSTPQYDLDVNNTIRATNLVASTEATFASFTFNGNTISSTNSTINLTPSGTNPVVYQGRLEVGYWDIYGSTITLTQPNTDINLNPTGTGIVNVNANMLVNGNIHATGDISADGDIQLGNQSTDTITFTGEIASDIIPSLDNTYDLGSPTLQWANVYAYAVNTANFNVGNIGFSGNTITTTNPNGDLILTANGTGSVVFEQLKITNNQISATQANQSIILQPQGTGNVQINSTTSLRIPVGTTSQRPDPASTGMIRYNTNLERYEGYNGSYWLALGGVSDVAGDTFITAELVPGAGDNVIRFYNNKVLTAFIDSDKFYTNRFETSNLRITNNEITTIAPATDIVMPTTGSKGVRIGNLRFFNNTITNTVNDAVTVFNGTGDGYFKIAGTNGFVMPTGGTDERPSLFELGMTRFNTDLQQMEIWNGLQWVGVGAGGGGGAVDQAVLTDIGVRVALMLG